MTNNSNPEVDEVNSRDPHKASWVPDEPMEPDGDDTAGVVIVESETLAMAYALHRKSRLRDDDSCSEKELRGWDLFLARQIERRINLYLHMQDELVRYQGQDDQEEDLETMPDMDDGDILGSHPLGRLMFMNILDDLRDGCSCADLFWEDVIGISIVSRTTKVKLHFSLEGIENGGSIAQPRA